MSRSKFCVCVCVSVFCGRFFVVRKKIWIFFFDENFIILIFLWFWKKFYLTFFLSGLCECIAQTKCENKNLEARRKNTLKQSTNEI